MGVPVEEGEPTAPSGSPKPGLSCPNSPVAPAVGQGLTEASLAPRNGALSFVTFSTSSHSCLLEDHSHPAQRHNALVPAVN